MSLGKKSKLFAPIKQEMLSKIQSKFSNIPLETIEDIYKIMTKGLVTETLLFVSIISMISRFKAGEREDEKNYGHYGAGIKLSAVKNDGSAKMQTKIMELLHDVIVEMQMAGSNFRNLQKYLGLHKMAICTLHSCYMFVLDSKDVDSFYENIQSDQMRRTQLDWDSITEKDIDINTLIEQTEYTKREAEVAKECYDLALELITQE